MLTRPDTPDILLGEKGRRRRTSSVSCWEMHAGATRGKQAALLCSTYGLVLCRGVNESSAKTPRTAAVASMIVGSLQMLPRCCYFFMCLLTSRRVRRRGSVGEHGTKRPSGRRSRRSVKQRKSNHLISAQTSNTPFIDSTRVAAPPGRRSAGFCGGFLPAVCW